MSVPYVDPEIKHPGRCDSDEAKVEGDRNVHHPARRGASLNVDLEPALEFGDVATVLVEDEDLELVWSMTLDGIEFDDERQTDPEWCRKLHAGPPW